VSSFAANQFLKPLRPLLPVKRLTIKFTFSSLMVFYLFNERYLYKEQEDNPDLHSSTLHA